MFEGSKDVLLFLDVDVLGPHEGKLKLHRLKGERLEVNGRTTCIRSGIWDGTRVVDQDTAATEK